MRASPIGRAAAMLLLAAASRARGDGERDTPDPTAIHRIDEPSPALPAPGDDPCAREPRCRLARFRRALAHWRHLEYLRRVTAAADAMDARIAQGEPYRVRYRLTVDFRIDSNLVLPGAQVSWGPFWYLRFGAWVGRYSHSSSYSDPTTMDYGSTTSGGTVFGSEVRITPIRFPIAPYLAVGWGYLAGNANTYSYATGSSDAGDANAHFVTLSGGLELIVPYFHIAVGYLFAHAFYYQALVNQMHDDLLRGRLKDNLNDNHHGVTATIGCSF